MYIISVKRIKNYLGDNLKEEEQYFEYASYDTYAGRFSSGYPMFDCLNHAKNFKTIKEAEQWWKNNKEYLNRYNKQYDFSTLAIRKICYKNVKSLSY